ncbi:cytochrome P450 [Abortiporus biennis]|nr:cytochrome P450 [Abortiporus biennis]
MADPLFPPHTKLFLQDLIHFFSPVIPTYFIVRLIVGNNISTLKLVALLLLSVVATIAARIHFKYAQQQKRAAAFGAKMPTPVKGSLPGNLDIVTKFGEIYEHGYMMEQFEEAIKTLGNTFNFRIMCDNMYFTSDVEVTQTMLATNFNDFEKGETFSAFLKSVLGVGVFNSDGALWKFHRLMTRPFFNKERLGHLDLFDKYIELAIVKMKQRLREGHAVDFQDVISRFTMDLTTEYLFGLTINSLEYDLPYSPASAPEKAGKRSKPTRPEEFSKAFDEAQEIVTNRSRLGWIWYWVEAFTDKTKQSMEVVDSFINPIVKDALAKAKKEGITVVDVNEAREPPADDTTLLDYLLKYTQDPSILHDEVLNILLAGRDTTAATITFLMYFLSQYPEVMRRLREEVLTVVGLTKRPNLEDMKEMKYLRAVINETLRLYPPVPLNFRFSIRDTTVPNNEDSTGVPFFVPAGTGIMYSPFLMQRRKDYWGPDADEFDPDRFLDERAQKYLTPNPHIFLPFGAGPRICLGQQFAYNEMIFVMIRLMQNFSSITHDFESQPVESRVPNSWAGLPGRKGVDKMNVKSHLTAFAKGGLWIKMTEVEQQ